MVFPRCLQVDFGFECFPYTIQTSRPCNTLGYFVELFQVVLSEAWLDILVRIAGICQMKPAACACACRYVLGLGSSFALYSKNLVIARYAYRSSSQVNQYFESNGKRRLRVRY